MFTSPIYCTNHPSTETLLRCNKCGKPYCIRCLERTPVGYRCRTCLNIQQAGYYTATPVDYVIAGGVGFFASILGGAIAVPVGGIFFLFSIFYAPIAGGAIAEAIWRAIQKHRGRYMWLVGCAAFILGSLLGALLYTIIGALLFVRGSIFSIGFLIYLALAIGTVYARLR